MSDFDEGRGGGEVVIVAATHPTPLVSNSGGKLMLLFGSFSLSSIYC